MRDRLLDLRKLIFEVVEETDGVGELEETLKWGEPSYVTSETKSGSTIRLGWSESRPDEYAMYFICRTNLVETFRETYPDEFKYDGNRKIYFTEDDDVSVDALKACISLALTYHLRKRTG